MSTLSSPNRVVWEYFDSLRRLVVQARNPESDAHLRQTAALAVVMSVNVVEVFFNLWFRVRVEERRSPQERAEFVKDLSYPRPASLDRKLREWPKRYLGNELDLDSGAGSDFMKLKRLRNSIIHFASTHETFRVDNVTIQGLADTSEYDALCYDHAAAALNTAEDMLAEVFALAGIDENNIPGLLHGWAGKIPQYGSNVV